MALIELNFGDDGTDDGDDDSVEIPIDDGESSDSAGRGLFGLFLLVALVAAAGYVLYRLSSSDDDGEFADIVFEDEAAEAETEPADE